jgi:hypothetical protein
VEPTTEANVAEYIEDNFDIAGFFIENCFQCVPEDCMIETDQTTEVNCGTLTVTQAVIQGTIKLIGGICVTSDNVPEAASQAPVCSQTLVCIEEPTPVCLACNDSNEVCENLRIVGANNLEANLIDISCEEFGGDGDAVWEVSGELVFSCND